LRARARHAHHASALRARPAASARSLTVGPQSAHRPDSSLSPKRPRRRRRHGTASPTLATSTFHRHARGRVRAARAVKAPGPRRWDCHARVIDLSHPRPSHPPRLLALLLTLDTGLHWPPLHPLCCPAPRPARSDDRAATVCAGSAIDRPC
jgi:hypothetical protein